MGQQQLLLLVVGVIIVAVAVVVGINQFGSSTDAGIVDNIIQTQQHFGSMAYGQFKKPASFGGKDFRLFSPDSSMVAMVDETPVEYVASTADLATLSSIYQGKEIVTTVSPSGTNTVITP